MSELPRWHGTYHYQQRITSYTVSSRHNDRVLVRYCTGRWTVLYSDTSVLTVLLPSDEWHRCRYRQ